MALTWPDGSGPDLIVDDGGDATLFVHQGVKVEKDPSLLEKTYTNPDLKCLMDRLKVSYERDPQHWHKVAEKNKRRVRGNHHRRSPAVSPWQKTMNCCFRRLTLMIR